MDEDQIDLLIQDLVDVRRLSVTDTETHEYIDAGLLEQLSWSVYVDSWAWGELSPDEQQFLRCYAASCQSSKAVLVGRSAARLGNIWVIPTSEEQVELALPNGQPSAKSRWFPGYLYRSMTVPDRDIVQVGDVRYTDSIRTAIDIARLYGFREGVVAFDSVFSGHNVEAANGILSGVQATLSRMRGTRGIGVAREALANATNLSESPYESLARATLLQNGIKPQPQVRIGNFRADLLLDDTLILDIDPHPTLDTKPDEAIREQHQRDAWLKEHGYEVLRLFADDVCGDETAWLADLAAARQRAGSKGPALLKPMKYAPQGPGRHLTSAEKRPGRVGVRSMR